MLWDAIADLQPGKANLSSLIVIRVERKRASANARVCMPALMPSLCITQLRAGGISPRTLACKEQQPQGWRDTK